jgi:hypothetical protein
MGFGVEAGYGALSFLLGLTGLPIIEQRLRMSPVFKQRSQNPYYELQCHSWEIISAACRRAPQIGNSSPP